MFLPFFLDGWKAAGQPSVISRISFDELQYGGARSLSKSSRAKGNAISCPRCRPSLHTNVMDGFLIAPEKECHLYSLCEVPPKMGELNVYRAQRVCQNHMFAKRSVSERRSFAASPSQEAPIMSAQTPAAASRNSPTHRYRR